MRILQSIPSLVPESGGTARSVVGLCSALAKHTHNIELLALDLGPNFSPAIVPDDARVNTTLVRNRLAIGQRQLWSPEFRRTLRNLIRDKEIDLLHDHCIWLPTHLDVTREARRAHAPVVVSTRGMLEPWSLNHRWLRKRIMWHLYQRRTLAQASLLHATSNAEAKNLRKLGIEQPIAVIPNAVNLPTAPSSTSRGAVHSPRTILFLSRIHPKKGLLNFFQAFNQVPTDQWRILIVGPDENGHLEEVREAAAKSNVQDAVTFVGAVDDEMKWQYYQHADLFVLPSYSENFGIVVAEALAAGVPVITTTGTPWHELVTTRSGWWVEPEVDALAAALREAMALSDEERKQMGQRGKQLITECYSWDSVATQMIEVYRWLLGDVAKPQCVLI